MSTPHPLTDAVAASAHEHGWVIESAHATSEGRVMYARCAACGARRVDIQPVTAIVPRALSRVSPSSRQIDVGAAR